MHAPWMIFPLAKCGEHLNCGMSDLKRVSEKPDTKPPSGDEEERPREVNPMTQVTW